MKKTTGSYNLDTIKYFYVYGLDATIECPYCKHMYEFDMGDEFIEYPKKYEVIEWECEKCEKEFKLHLNIEMVVNVEYWETKDG